MKNIPLLLGTLVVTLLLIVGVAVMFSKSAEPKTVDVAVLQNNVRHIKGATSPKVTITEFSDFQCPGCKGFQPIVDQILTKYPNDVRVIYRHFPLITIHQYSRQAAEAAEAADTFGKFWEYHDLLFAEQETWAASKNETELEQKFAEYAAKLQIDKNQFMQRIKDQEVVNKVKTDISDGNKLNIGGTPTFYVNDRLIAAPDLVAEVESLVGQPSSVSATPTTVTATPAATTKPY